MFRQLTKTIYASPQIDLDDIATAKAIGIVRIINNRPEDESPDQTPGPVIEAAAREAGIDYVAIPVTHAGFSLGQVEAMGAALEDANGPILAYCRSGTRSTLLWALARAKEGADLDEITRQANSAGYDTTPVRPLMDMLAADAI